MRSANKLAKAAIPIYLPNWSYLPDYILKSEDYKLKTIDYRLPPAD